MITAERRRVYGGKVRYSAKSYIQRGLLMHLDGIENVSYGTHDNTATTWKDLTGNGFNATLNGGASWADDSFVLTISSQNYAGLKTQLLNCRTLELVIKVDNTYNTNYKEACPIGLINGYVGVLLQIQGTIFYTGTNRYYITPEPRIQYSQKFSTTVVVGDSLTTLTNWHGYFNGTELSMGRNTTGIGSLNLRINARNDRRFDGNVYAVRAYDTILTPSEIMRNFKIDKQRFNI